MVSSGNGEIGAAKLTGEVLSIVGRIPELVKQVRWINKTFNNSFKYVLLTDDQYWHFTGKSES